MRTLRILGASLLVMLLALPRTAAAQLSGAVTASSGSTCSPANGTDGYCGFASALTTNVATQIQSRFEWNVNADATGAATRDTTGTAEHTLTFDAVAVGGYRLDIGTRRQGDLNRIQDAAGCSGSADVSAVTGTSNVPVASGSLGLADPGILASGGTTTNLPFNQTSSAIIFGVANGVPQTHTLTFTWSGGVRSNSCEAAIRLGGQNGTTTGCTACGYPGSPFRAQMFDGHVVTVTFTSLCGNGTVDAGVAEQCDLGALNGTPGACCTATCAFKPAGTACRASGGICDPAEVCSGAAGSCPADAKSPAGTICRSSTAACDLAETCDGASNGCPADVLSPAGTTCRPAAGPCDAPETCSGSSSACPADAKQMGLCRAAVGPCDVAESCDGVGDACPSDVVAPAGVACRPGSGDVCDPPESCNGSSPVCPSDTIAPAGTVCNAGSGDLCDPAETCSGTPGAPCPADTVAPGGTACRPGSGDACDPDETCPGIADQPCPANVLAPASTVCRAGSGDLCDPAETCPGIAGQACPANTISPAGTVCRPGSGDQCDPEEACSGIAATPCPGDTRAAAGTVCRAAADVCDQAESCTGTSQQPCPADAVHGAPFVCRPAAAACDLAEHCDGSAVSCPADTLAPSGTVCRPAVSSCDVVETCPGDSTSCPPDVTTGDDADGDAVCDQIDRCPDVADPAQLDSDGDGRGDECDPCTNVLPAFAERQRLVVTKLAAPAGDEKLKIKGRMVPFLQSPPIDPVAHGVRLLLQNRVGVVVLDAVVPGGAYSPATKAGWRVVEGTDGRTFQYKNPGSVGPPVAGITTIVLIERDGLGFTTVSVGGKGTTLPLASGDEPLKFTLVVDHPVARTGQCSEMVFPATVPDSPSCQFSGSGATLRCK